MSRFQLSLNVDDVGAAVLFYTELFGVGPAKHRDGYANFIVEDPPMKLVVIEGEGAAGSINHVGIEFADGEEVEAQAQRLATAGLPMKVDETHTCCFATQDKAWTQDVDGVPWELYTVTDHTDEFGENPHALDQLLPPVTSRQLAVALDDPGIAVIDAQGEGGFGKAHLDGAIDIGLDDVIAQVAAVVPDLSSPVVLYCSDSECLGAEFVGTQLVNAGYTDVRRFPGGVQQWIDEGHTTSTSR